MPLHAREEAHPWLLGQLLAGAKVNELTKHRQTALHLAAQQDLPTICSVLLENGVDFSAVDENGNNGSVTSTRPQGALWALVSVGGGKNALYWDGNPRWEWSSDSDHREGQQEGTGLVLAHRRQAPEWPLALESRAFLCSSPSRSHAWSTEYHPGPPD